MTSLLPRRLARALPAGALSLLLLAPTSGCAPAHREVARPVISPPATQNRDLPSGVASGNLSDRIVDTARSLLASPYRDSGDDPQGFDCSGFTKFVFASAGITIPRTTSRQATVGLWKPGDELARGDLVFFGRRREEPLHVGLVISEPGEPLTMIHASSSLGVVTTEVTSSSYWLDRLLFGRRVLPSS